MPTSFTNPTLVNVSSLGGDQSNAMTAALPNGGYVVAWTSINNAQTDVFFQRFDAGGNAVGAAAVAGGTTATSERLQDLIVTDDGRITLAWSVGNSASVVTRSFDAVTGVATSGEVVTTSDFTNPSVQLVATAANQYKLLMISNLTVEQATLNTAGATVAAKASISLSGAIAPGLVLAEAITGAAGEQLMLGVDGTIISTTGQVFAEAAGTSADIVKLSDGTYVLAQTPSVANQNAMMMAVSGIGPISGNYNLSGQVIASAVSAPGPTGATTFDKTIVSLGGGRIMMFYVADTGITFNINNDPDGLYSVIYNTLTGAFEGGSNTLIRSLGQILSSGPTDLVNLSIDAAVLADGRVALTFAQKFGLFGFDIFSSIFDPRVTGANMAGTAAADTLVGTNFANSPDTVSYAAVAGLNVKVDLNNNLLNTGAAAGDSLTSIENVTGTGLADEIYGNASANAFIGGVGADRLVGRDGSDTLAGGADDDLIAGGAGADSIQGDSGNDILNGGADADTLNGGGDTDSITGGEGNDVILGGDGADRIYGNAGDDEIDGGTGIDFISGGTGNDTIAGGADNDTITAGNGDDVIDGGAGNDLINAGAGFNVVDGGTGGDTISYSQVAIAPGQLGVLVDLDPGSDPFGNTDGVVEDDDVLVNIESIFGGDGNDFLFGNGLTNVLRGFGGDDTLFGRGNNDVLIGGAGADRFVYDLPSTAGNDQIRDFTAGSDEIVIVSAAFGNIHLGNIAASFVSNADALPAANGNPQFLFDNAGAGAGRLFFDSNGNGAGSATLIATLTFTTANGLTTFGIGDFAFL